MKVIISQLVRARIKEFYDYAMKNHITLSEETVEKKELRMYKELQTLGHAQGFRKARLNKKWASYGWHEFVCEDFLFAYEVVRNKEGERYVIVHDAEHSLLYR